MLEFSKAPFLFLHFSYYTLMIFLMISVILLSMLMILLTILSVSSHLIFGNNLNLLLNVNLIHETLGHEVAFLFQCLENSAGFVWTDVKMDGSVFEEKWSFKMLGFTLSSKLDWCSYIISIAKSASKKIWALICSMKFLSPVIALNLYKSTIHPCMEYCCHIWAGAPSCYLELLDKLQKRICRTVGPSLAAALEPMAHHWNVTSLSHFYRYYFARKIKYAW